MFYDTANDDLESVRNFSTSPMFTNFLVTLSQPRVWLVLLFVTCLFALVVFLSLWARATILHGLQKVRSAEPAKTFDLLRFGLKKIARLFLIEVFFIIPNAVGLILLFVLFPGMQKPIIWVLFIIVLVLVVLYNLFLFLFRHYAYCFGVLENFRAWAAVKAGLAMLVKNFSALILVKLIELGLWILAALCLVVALAILILPLIAIGAAVMYIGGPAALFVVAGIALAFLVLALLFLKGIINVFFHGYLTLVYWQIN